MAKENRSAKLAAVLARALPDATPHEIERAVMAMQIAARAHKRHAERVCSFPMTEAQERRAEKRLAKLTRLAQEALLQGAKTWKMTGDASVGVCGISNSADYIQLDFGGDPRGPCGRLIIGGMPGDGWGEGFAIYV